MDGHINRCRKDVFKIEHHFTIKKKSQSRNFLKNLKSDKEHWLET